MTKVDYKCGNYSTAEDAPEKCPHCEAERREPPPRRFNTVRLTCPGPDDN